MLTSKSEMPFLLKMPPKKKYLKKKKKPGNGVNKKLLFGICAGVGVLLIAGIVIGSLLFLGSSSSESEAPQTVEAPPPPGPTELEKELAAFNSKVSTSANKLELLGECEDLILKHSAANMSPSEAQIYEKILIFYRDIEESALKSPRQNAADTHKRKIEEEKKRVEAEIKRKRELAEQERKEKEAAEKARREREAAEKALKAKRELAKTELDALKKSSASAIVTACKGEDPAKNAEAIEKILTEVIENKYKDETDEQIQPQVEELKTWAEELQKSFRNGAKIATLMQGKDKALDNLIVPAPNKKRHKLKLNFQNSKVGVTADGIPLGRFLKIKKNRIYIPFVIAAVAEKIEASGDLWAYKMLTNEKDMPDDVDTAKITELKNIAGIEEESGDDGEE